MLKEMGMEMEDSIVRELQKKTLISWMDSHEVRKQKLFQENAANVCRDLNTLEKMPTKKELKEEEKKVQVKKIKPLPSKAMIMKSAYEDLPRKDQLSVFVDEFDQQCRERCSPKRPCFWHRECKRAEDVAAEFFVAAKHFFGRAEQVMESFRSFQAEFYSFAARCSELSDDKVEEC